MNKFKNAIFILIGVIMGTLGYVVADDVISIISANQVGFSSEKTSKTNIQEAVDELYDMAETHCPSNHNCHNTKNSRVVPATYGETFKAIVYLNPVNPRQNCTKDTSSIGSGITGCMKWYAFSETADTYNLILDHNTFVGNYSDSVAKLTDLTKAENQGGYAWNINLSPRMIYGIEVANITGNKNWNATDQDTDYYLDSRDNTLTTNSQNKSKYYWLFDNLHACLGYGCLVADETPHDGGNLAWGYWLKDTYSSAKGWRIMISSHVEDYNINDLGTGLRPVITVNKSDLGL